MHSNDPTFPCGQFAGGKCGPRRAYMADLLLYVCHGIYRSVPNGPSSFLPPLAFFGLSETGESLHFISPIYLSIPSSHQSIHNDKHIMTADATLFCTLWQPTSIVYHMVACMLVCTIYGKQVCVVSTPFHTMSLPLSRPIKRRTFFFFLFFPKQTLRQI